MNAPIPLRDYVVGGLVEEVTVNALLAFGEPMLSDTAATGDVMSYRAWIRLRHGGRAFSHWTYSTPQEAAAGLLRKLEGRAEVPPWERSA